MATNHEVGSSILSGRTTFPCQPGMPEIPRFARDFACGLPLRSRPQDGSSSILSGRTILPTEGVFDLDARDHLSRIQILRENPTCPAFDRGRDDKGIPKSYPGFVLNSKCR